MLIIISCGTDPGGASLPSEATPRTTGTPSATSLTPTQSPVEPTSIPNPYNPLTGLKVADPSLLELPAVLVSISTFPVTARPQAGPSFAPLVFEIYITEGTNRYLGTFYGEFPAPETLVVGNCKVRDEPFVQTELLFGNRVWLDTNQNNLQDDWERGVGGICVNLYDTERNLLQQTSTDSNGHYGFNVEAGKYFIAMEKVNGMEFVQKDAGDDEQDSDVDPTSGWSDELDVTDSRLDLDVGLILLETPPPTSDLPPARVGPVRSGRLVYADIADFFKGSCLIYAYASAEVLVELPKCAFVDHNIQGGGYMLDISEMRELAGARRDPETQASYVRYAFSETPPSGGKPASRLDVYTAWLNQTGWVFDPLSQAWWRYVDNGDQGTPGFLRPEVDRLNRRQLLFQNVVVLFTQHDVVSPTNLDIHLERGLTGKALLFRDGQVYSIRWSTEKRGPVQFLFENGEPFPLKPGHTWISVVTPQTTVIERKPAHWYLRFSQPKGAK